MFGTRAFLENRSPATVERADAPREYAAPANNPRWQALALNPIAVQTKRAIAEPGDTHEQEAEQFAKQFAEHLDDNAKLAGTPRTHGDHSAELSKPAPAPAQALVPVPVPVHTAAPPIVHAALQSPSVPLDDNTRTLMEARLDANFRDVRLHTDAVAARANVALNARAFTSGRDIAFGAGQFSPDTASGRHLIAHELVHVKQQSRGAAPLVQRAPALSGRSTREIISDSIAADVDRALAESATLKKYIDAKVLRKIAGHISVDDPAIFAAKYRKYAANHSGMPDVKDVPGYTDRAANTVEFKSRSADVEAVVHETVHFNSSEKFAGFFGHALNEGITEYFTEKILGEQKLKSGRAYRAELKLATAFVASVGEDAAAAAYFKGDSGALKTITAALGAAGSYSVWRKKAFSDKPTDWPAAATLLTKAMGR